MPQKILIVDDDKGIIEFLTVLLEKKGYEITAAMDGVQAMEKAMKIKPDLIILDIMMPGGSGITVYNRIKQSVLTQKIPVIFLTAMPIANAKAQLPPNDQTIILSKPVEQEGFISAIDAQLRGQI